jgi:hypothetical protein
MSISATSDNSFRKARSPWVIAESYAPMIIGIVGCGSAYFYGLDFFELSKCYKWHLDNLYISAFGFFVFAGPFMFAYYTYVKTIDNRYIAAARSSILFARAERFMVRAIVISALIALICIPFMIVVPEPEEKGFAFYAFCVWFGLVIYGTCLILRSAYNFTSILEVAMPTRFNSSEDR